MMAGRGSSPVLWVLYSAQFDCEYYILWRFCLCEQIALIIVKGNLSLLDALDTVSEINYLNFDRLTIYSDFFFFLQHRDSELA
jgi:hypothetical protein